LIAVERIKESGGRVGDVKQIPAAAVVRDRNRSRSIAELVREHGALRNRSDVPQHLQDFSGKRIRIAAADGRHEARRAGDIYMPCEIGTIETP
jgi:hypothetical protein